MFNMILIEKDRSPVEITYDGKTLKTTANIYRVIADNIKKSFVGLESNGILAFKLPNRVVMTGMSLITEGLTYRDIEGKGKLYHHCGNYYFITTEFLNQMNGDPTRRIDCGYRHIGIEEINKDITGSIDLRNSVTSIPTLILYHALGKEMPIESIEVLDVNGVLLNEIKDSNSYLCTDSKSTLYKINMARPPGLYIGGLDPKILIAYYNVIMNMDDMLINNLNVMLDTYYGVTQETTFV